MRYATRFAVQKDDHVLYGFTDVSEEFRAAVLTQTEEGQLQKKNGKQQHEPFSFLGGRCFAAQGKWTTYEKEAYVIVQTFKKPKYTFWGATPTHVFIDHKDLLLVFAPLALRSDSRNMYNPNFKGGQYICFGSKRS